MSTRARIVILSMLLVAAIIALVTVGNPTVDERKINAKMEAYYQRGEYAQALEIANSEALRGNVVAQLLAGSMYLKGQGVDKNIVHASKMFALAVQQDNPDAQNMLGEIHLGGLGVHRNYARALELFQKAAKNGSFAGKINLCTMYAKGMDAGFDYGELARSRHLGAQVGNMLAPYEIANMYLSGEGLIRDNTEAAKWFHVAAELGMPEAQLAVATMYLQGVGVPQDYVLAHMWFNLAAGGFGAIHRSSEFNHARQEREKLNEKMTGDQIAEAQTLARNWQRKSWFGWQGL